MLLEELNYHLPPERIAERPCEPRDACRLLVLERVTGRMEHLFFRDLPRFLRAGDLLVLNSAKVTPARVRATLEDASGTEVELLVTDAGTDAQCRAMLSPSRKVRPGSLLRTRRLGAPIRVVERGEHGFWKLQLMESDGGWRQVLEREGEMPLPPYILKRRAVATDVPEDRAWYQTVFAEREGAIAAPTAGLHFTREMLEGLEGRGVGSTRLFLRVGAGTFLPIRTERVEDHRLLPEEYELDGDCVARIVRAREGRGRVVAVGTTVVRTLEYAALGGGGLRPGTGQTTLMIHPPFSFQVVDGLLTNFHLPRSTLLALVSAFAGTDLVRRAYQEAIQREYRFYSYGDAMLIL